MPDKITILVFTFGAVRLNSENCVLIDPSVGSYVGELHTFDLARTKIQFYVRCTAVSVSGLL